MYLIFTAWLQRRLLSIATFSLTLGNMLGGEGGRASSYPGRASGSYTLVFWPVHLARVILLNKNLVTSTPSLNLSMAPSQPSKHGVIPLNFCRFFSCHFPLPAHKHIHTHGCTNAHMTDTHVHTHTHACTYTCMHTNPATLFFTYVNPASRLPSFEFQFCYLGKSLKFSVLHFLSSVKYFAHPHFSKS